MTGFCPECLEILSNEGDVMDLSGWQTLGLGLAALALGVGLYFFFSRRS